MGSDHKPVFLKASLQLKFNNLMKSFQKSDFC